MPLERIHQISPYLRVVIRDHVPLISVILAEKHDARPPVYPLRVIPLLIEPDLEIRRIRHPTLPLHLHLTGARVQHHVRLLRDLVRPPVFEPTPGTVRTPDVARPQGHHQRGVIPESSKRLRVYVGALELKKHDSGPQRPRSLNKVP